MAMAIFDLLKPTNSESFQLCVFHPILIKFGFGLIPGEQSELLIFKKTINLKINDFIEI